MGMTIKQIESILSDPFCRGKDGKDYMPMIDELEQELWTLKQAKLERELEKRQVALRKEHNRFKRVLASLKKLHKDIGDTQELRAMIISQINEYNNFTDSI